MDSTGATRAVKEQTGRVRPLALERWELVVLVCCAVLSSGWVLAGLSGQTLAIRLLLALLLPVAAAGLVLLGRAHPPAGGIRTGKECLRAGLVAGAVVGGAMLLALLAHWPGLMTYDSVDQWQQVVTGSYSDHHPLVDTLARSVLIRAFGTPAAVALAQILLISTAVGWCVGEIARWNGPRALLAAAVVLSALSPWNLWFGITLWKDVPYTGCFLLAEAAVLRLLADGGRRRGIWTELVLVPSITGLMLFRYNGLATVLGAGLCAVVLLRGTGSRRLSVRLACLAVLLYGVVRVSVEWTVRPVHDRWFGLPLLAVFQVAAGAASGELPDSEEQRRSLDALLPLSRWGSRYSCITVNPLVAPPAFDTALLGEKPGPVYRAWVHLGLRHPGTLLRHQACASQILWKLDRTPLYVHDWAIPPNPFGLVQRPVLPTLRRWLDAYRVWTLRPEVIPWIWQPALVTLALGWFVVSGALSSGRRELLWLLVLPLTHLGALALTILTPDVRYQYPIHELALLALGLTRLPRGDSRGERPLSGAGADEVLRSQR